MTGRKTHAVDWVRARERLQQAAQALADHDSDPRRIAAAYRERAAGLARPPEAPAANEESRQSVIFRLGDGSYAAPLSRIERIFPDPVCTPLPGVAERWAGVMKAGGEIVPVLDLARVLGLAGPEPPAGRNVLKLRQEKPEVGLLVGEVLEVRGIPTSGLRPFTGNVPLVEGVAPGNIVVLDLESRIAKELLQ